MPQSADNNQQAHTRRYFAIILLGPIVLLAFWVVFKIGLEDRFSRHLDAGYPGYCEQPAEVLFIGSSHTRQSYDIAAVEAATGRSAYAMAYGSLDQNLMNLLLEDLLRDPARRPKILVLEAYATKLAQRSQLEDPRFFFDLPPGLKLRFIKNYLQLNPELSARLDLFGLIVNRGTEQLWTYPLNHRILARLSYRGAYRAHVSNGVSESEFRSFQPELAGPEPDPIQFAALNHTIQLCKRYGVRLMLAESPMPKPATSEPDIHRMKDVYRAVSLANHLPYLDGDEGFPTDDPAYFADATHLSTAGRTLYTANLIKSFGPLLVADRGPSSLVQTHPPHTSGPSAGGSSERAFKEEKSNSSAPESAIGRGVEERL
jgi:hypothetical protein